VTDFDLVTIGDLNRDWLIQVQRFAGEDDEVPISHLNRSFGGDAANIAVAASRLGLRTALIASIGDDLDGKALLAELVEKGVDTGAVQVVPEEETGLVIGIVRGDGQRNLYSLRGANAHLRIRSSQLELIKKCRAVHISDPLPELVPSLLEALDDPALFVSLDPGSISAARGLSNLQPLLSKTRLFLANEGEYRMLTEEMDLLEAARRIRVCGPQIAVIKQGSQGCIVAGGGEPIYVKGFVTAQA
jgi:sugar/nucleoside kinase (ribokinase family)